MIIVNPIYDVAFKYLMEDTEIAKGFLSQLLGLKIKSLQLRPTEQFSVKEQSEELEIPDRLQLFRLDFKAVIDVKDGRKIVLIELQKSKKYTESRRFRKYLGRNYFYPETIIKKKIEEEHDFPIITVYFLGYRLKNISTPVLKIARVYTDLVSDVSTFIENKFIETLTHDSYFIQIPLLKNQQRNKLEEILNIFNQTYVMNDNNRFLEIKNTSKKDPLVEKMLKRLNKATLDQEVIAAIEIEKDFDYYKSIMDKKLAKRDKALAKKDEALAKKDEALVKAARKLYKLGMSENEIAETLDTSLSNIKEWIQKN